MRVSRLAKEVTKGVLGSMIDYMIWQVALVGASVGKTGSRGMYEAFREADEVLAKVNHRSLAATWRELTRKRLLTYVKRKNLYYPQITELGRKRLAQLFPKHEEKRLWDQKIYLITYDIPEKGHNKRDSFRKFIYRIGARLLQESTWITPYNPRQLINEFVREEGIPGVIIVSDIGRDGGVGEMTIQDLLVKVYKLEELNSRYDKFIHHVQEKIKHPKYLFFEYLSILKNDPQLPFELLPKGWLGERAYQDSQNLQKKMGYH